MGTVTMMKSLLLLVAVVAIAAHATEDQRCGVDGHGDPIAKGKVGKTAIMVQNDLAPTLKLRMCHMPADPKTGISCTQQRGKIDTDYIDCPALNVTKHPERIPRGESAEVSFDDKVQTMLVVLYDAIGQFNVSSACYITKGSKGWPTEKLVMNEAWWNKLESSCVKTTIPVETERKPALEVTFMGELSGTPMGPSCNFDDPFQKAGCKAGEVNITVQGVSGSFCSPKCDASGACPTDVCPGTVAKPTCALQDQSGNKYCALVCDPTKTGITCSSDEHMTCQKIQGTGICTYYS